MKNTLLIISVLLLSLAGCKKEESKLSVVPPSETNPYAGRPSPYTGIVTAEKNGRPWKGYVWAAFFDATPDSLKPRFNIALDNYINIDGDTFRRDMFQYNLIKPQAYKPNLERYFLFLPDSLFPNENWRHFTINDRINYREFVQFLIFDIDAVYPPAEMLLTEPNFMEITSFNPTTMEFSARFEHTFLHYNQRDTIRFRNGSFSGRIHKY